MGRSGKTGRDSVIQKVLSCQSRDYGLFPQEQLRVQVLGQFPVENEHPTVQRGRLKEVVRPRRMKALYLGSESRDTGF